MTRCTHWRRVPLDILREARDRSRSGWVDHAVQCQMPEHRAGDHYGFLDDAAYATALWLRWAGGEATSVVLADCLVRSAGAHEESCCLFVGHGGRHTWEEDRSETEPVGQATG
ncbi:hypothetical protein [Streptomyces sp. SID4985]|uniref:hypothetical protein n=1 Tax=unclassified Streptomyces TaxID=2593676 RepID=UPI0013716D56|nr:hypothetical protein [Streptomyces sp. SID4985]MYQ44113.1 hypothetical protein [Streptomyces sp. SID4985]